MSEVKVNKISPRTNCGTVTLGDSGDSFTIPSGVTITNNGTQTGFGRTGTVDWQTGSIKTGNFTAANGEGYFVNTTSGEITMNLPSSPSAGNIVSIKDYAYTFATNNFKVDGNGSPIGGSTGTIPVTYSTNGTSKTFVYVDGTKGWLVVNESTDTSEETNPQFVAATGGTITTVCTNFKVHTFTGPGTFTVTCAGNSGGSNTVDYLVLAGGGGGGYDDGGGGGAGGYRESSGAATGCYTASPLGSCVSALPVTAQGYPITVGSGGAGGPNGGPNGVTGSNSIFSTITSAGGGGGGRSPTAGSDGGSGGGGGGGAGGAGGTGNVPPTSPAQGTNGGTATPGCNAGGGGGGATTAGTNGSGSAPSATSGPGGNGATSSINASPVTRAGGGGGGAFGTKGTGGSGGGGAGGQYPGTAATAGTANTGGGGGGGSTTGGGTPRDGGQGGSGIVIIRYKFQ